MLKKWEDAHKLCKFILMYEPGNKTAKEFLPLIESKLADTESEESSDESSDDDEDEDDEEDEDDDESDEDGSEEEDEKEENGKKEFDDDDDVIVSSRIPANSQNPPFKFGLSK